MKIEPRYSPHSHDGYVGSNDISTTRHLATVAHRAPVPVDRLERMLKVLQDPPNAMGEHTPLHACACLDHACRVRLFLKALTCWPRCLPPPHLRCRSAPLVYRGQHCGSPHKGMLVVRRDGSGNGCGEPSTCPLLNGDTTGAELCIPLQNALTLCNTCIGLTVDGRLGPSTRLSGLSQLLMMRFWEWWT